MSLVDHVIEDSEEQILSIYLASSNMDDHSKKEFKQKLADDNISIDDITLPTDADELYKFYLIDMAVLTVHSDLSAMNDEITTLYRSEEHTSELQSRPHLVCRLLLEKKNK